DLLDDRVRPVGQIGLDGGEGGVGEEGVVAPACQQLTLPGDVTGILGHWRVEGLYRSRLCGRRQPTADALLKALITCGQHRVPGR
ncbi:MAG: hypothetical protein M3246_07110, partial [Actinomycetota bacterium]|nr:hypothetical protein [Actinomycetota bacterium]